MTHWLPEAILQASARRQGAGDFVGPDGVRRFYGFATLAVGTPKTESVTAVVGIPRDTALASASRLLAWNLAGLSAASLLALSAAWIGGGLVVVRPLDLLRKAAQRLSTGELGARTGLERAAGEIGALAGAFDSMAASLERAMAERDRAEAALRQRVAEAQSLAEIGRAVTSSLDQKVVLDLVVDRAVSLMTGKRFALAIVDTEGQDGGLRFIATRGLSDNFAETVKTGAPRDSVIARSVVERRPVSSPDVLQDPELELTPARRAAVEAEGYRAVLSVPLLIGEQAVGALVTFRDEPGCFPEGEVELLEAFAAQAAVALENAHLYEAADRRRRAAETLAELSGEVSKALELTLVAQRTVEGLRSVLNGNSATLYLLVPETGDLRSIATDGDLGPDSSGGVTLVCGTGVSGLAVEKRRPVMTGDMLGDGRIALAPESRSPERSLYRQRSNR